jgi:4'-phosphopantetheinyl transferase
MPDQHNSSHTGKGMGTGDQCGNPTIRIVTKDADEMLDRAPEGNAVWVWPIKLDTGPSVSEPPLPLELTIEERARAERYKFIPARWQFVAGRARLRRLLGGYLRLPPSEVPITYTAAGKPVLADSAVDLHFNVSHSHGLVVVAVASRPVGIDIERLRMVDNPEGLIRRFFSQVEQETYLALPAILREEGFFRGWTSKEALIKARGLSIACLGDFDVELHPDRPAALLAARHRDLADSSWRMAAWAPAAGYAAAVALEED